MALPTAYYDDGQAQIWHGDALEALAGLPDQSVHCCVTSPPYYALRDYGVDGQIGLEATPEEFIGKLVGVFRELRRVLRDDGTCWINIGDSYVGGGRGGHDGIAALGHGRPQGAGNDYPRATASQDLKPKDLMMIPARLALALQADGWWLRSDIIWHKTAPMPESVTDRPTSAHEHIFLLSKSANYYYDAEAVREKAIHEGRIVKASDPVSAKNGAKGSFGQTAVGFTKHDTLVSGRNQRNVWALGPDPSPEAHFATFPREIPRRAILAGTSEYGVCAECSAPWERKTEHESVVGRMRGTDASHYRANLSGPQQSHVYAITTTTGWQPSCTCDAPVISATVIDPFMGSGRTAEVAKRLGRRVIGIELNREYIDTLIIPKCQQRAMFMEAAGA